MLRNSVVISILLLMLSISSVNGQKKESVAGLQKYADKSFGTSDFLVNGWKYFPEYFNAKGNPYFQDSDWMEGSIVSVDGETFSNLELRYNIQMDEVVLKENLKDGEPVFVMLNSDFIESFSVGSHKFIGAESIPNNEQLQGYVEVIYCGTLKFYTKHRKSFVGNYNANTPEGSISKQNSLNYLFINGQLSKASSKKAFLKIFPDHKKQIAKFMKSNKIRYSKASTAQLERLIKFCDEL